MIQKLIEWFPSFESSVGDGSLALRVKSFVPLVVAVAAMFHYALNGDTLASGVDNLQTILSAAVALVSAVVHAYAWFRDAEMKKLGAGKYAR